MQEDKYYVKDSVEREAVMMIEEARVESYIRHFISRKAPSNVSHTKLLGR